MAPESIFKLTGDDEDSTNSLKNLLKDALKPPGQVERVVRMSDSTSLFGGVGVGAPTGSPTINNNTFSPGSGALGSTNTNQSEYSASKKTIEIKICKIPKKRFGEDIKDRGREENKEETKSNRTLSDRNVAQKDIFESNLFISSLYSFRI